MSLLSCVWVLCVIVVCFVLFLFLFCVVFEFFGEGRFLLFWSCFCCCCFCGFLRVLFFLFIYFFLFFVCFCCVLFLLLFYLGSMEYMSLKKHQRLVGPVYASISMSNHSTWLWHGDCCSD